MNRLNHNGDPRQQYFLKALEVLDQTDRTYRKYDLPTVAQQASREDPDFKPRLGLVGCLKLVSGANKQDLLTRKEKAYPPDGTARDIIAELVELGQVETTDIAPVLLDEHYSYYIRRPNEDGRLYWLAASQTN